MSAVPAFAVVADPAPPARRYRLMTADDLAKRPPLRWRIKGVLPETGLAAIYGPSGCGKTFLTLDMAAAMADGGEWFGRKVRPCRVTYLALEGEHGIANRIRAFRSVRGSTCVANVHFVAEPFSLIDVRDVPDLAESIREAGAADGVVIIDTLNRAAAGVDENNGLDMGVLIAKATELQRLVGGLVLLVHHSGKDANRGARGHSSLFAALDAAIEVTRKPDGREWKVAKSKDGEDGRAHPFRLDVVEIGVDEDGEPVTSCVVNPDEKADPASRRAMPPNSGNMRIAFDAVSAALKDSALFGKAGAPPTRPCMALEDAIRAAAVLMPVEEKRRKERAGTAITSLVSRGLLGCKEGWIWLA